MNLIEEFNKGQKGGNKGLPMGEGLTKLSKAINGVQKSRIYGVAAAAKAGKSTFVDYAFVIQPYLHCVKHKIKAEWLYFSFELDRVSKEFDFAAYFLWEDYKIEYIELPPGITYTVQGVVHTKIPLSPDYLRGRMQDDKGDTIKVSDEIKTALRQTYTDRIIPLFGEFDKNGTRVSKGYITFIEQKDNPTGIYKYLKRHAEKNGKFIYFESGKVSRVGGYKPNEGFEDKFTIVVVDHLRKLIPEQGWQMKQTVDKMIEYMVEIRNWCGYTFVPIIHTNRNMADIDKLRFAKDELYPTSDEIKDTGNLAEDADYVFTIFNPNDEKYKLVKHFGLDLRDSKGNPMYLNMRSFHLVESRHCIYPQHFRATMLGNVKSFKQLNIK